MSSKLGERAEAYGMEASHEKSKVMMNSINSNSCVNITMNGNSHEDVPSFKYLEVIMSKDGTCSSDIRTEIINNMAE